MENGLVQANSRRVIGLAIGYAPEDNKPLLITHSDSSKRNDIHVVFLILTNLVPMTTICYCGKTTFRMYISKTYLNKYSFFRGQTVHNYYYIVPGYVVPLSVFTKSQDKMDQCNKYIIRCS